MDLAAYGWLPLLVQSLRGDSDRGAPFGGGGALTKRCGAFYSLLLLRACLRGVSRSDLDLQEPDVVPVGFTCSV